MVNNPHFYGQSTTGTPNQIEDGVDFPHTGIIKALADGLGQNYAISGFNITFDSATQIDVGTGVIFRDGKRHEISAGNNLALGRTTASENSYHLVVVDKDNAIAIRSPSAKDKVANYTVRTLTSGTSTAHKQGDTVIAVVTHNGSNPAPVQYLTVDKAENSLSIGYSNSGTYAEGLTIDTDAGDTTIENKVSDKDIIFKVKDGSSAGTESMRIDADINQVKIKSLGIGTAAELTITESSDDITIKNTVSNKDIIFNINAGGTPTELMRLDGSASRIGIGTSSPAATVDIAGDLRVTNNIYQQYKDLTNDLAVGWHTIAHIKGRSGGSASGTASASQRGIAQVIIKEESSSRHALYEFKLNHLFGVRNSIQMENTSYYSTNIIQQVRIKENDIYDGAVFQVYVADATNNLQVYITDNFAESGWYANDGVADADNSGHDSLGLGYNNAYSTFSAIKTYNLDNVDGQGTAIVDGGSLLGGNTFVSGDLIVESGMHFRSTRLLKASIGAGTTLTEGSHAGKYLLCNGNVTLPASSVVGVHFTILNVTSGNITVGRNSNDINGVSSDATVGTFNGVTCIAIGGNDWLALGV